MTVARPCSGRAIRVGFPPHRGISRAVGRSRAGWRAPRPVRNPVENRTDDAIAPAVGNAIDVEAARIKGIGSAVAGRARILVTPDLEADGMIAKNLVFLANAEAAGTVAGARAPIGRISRADAARVVSAAALHVHAARRPPAVAAG